MRNVALAVLVCICPLLVARGESIITLKSGAVLQGDIVSDTNDVVQIRAYSHNHTISSLRDVARSDIQGIYLETTAEVAERTDYEAVSKFQLDPNQEQSIEWYNQWIGVFQKFLDSYPASDKANAVRQYIELCQTESQNVADGKVKFAGKWMTAKEKRVQVAQAAIESLKARLADFQRQRAKLTENLGVAQGNLAGAQQKLQSLQDVQVPINQTATSSGIRRDSTGRIISAPVQTRQQFTGAYQTVPNSEKPAVLSQIQFYQQQVGQGQAMLASLDPQIADVQQVQIPRAEQAYRMAVAQLHEVPRPVVANVEQPAPPPPPPPPPPAEVSTPPTVAAPVQPWFVRNWYWIVFGSVGILALAGLVSMPLLKRRAVQLEALEEQQNQQRRFMYEQLRKIFERIFVEGQRPAGKYKPEGEVVPLGQGEDASGGGRWFVVGPEYIWAVHNNGRDDDNWALNNVVTDGHGAIGAYVAADEELVKSVRRLAGQAS
ncbi:MAG TPA: hypothetical protein VMP11_00075 [Verrucomicrobiae bacterium]|nr:hypothetical protein [Verrucomicrobiae bacterium]